MKDDSALLLYLLLCCFCMEGLYGVFFQADLLSHGRDTFADFLPVLLAHAYYGSHDIFSLPESIVKIDFKNLGLILY